MYSPPMMFWSIPFHLFLSSTNWSTAFWPVPVIHWYVETTILLILYSLCKPAIATSIWIVEQLGLAMIISSSPITSPLISGITSFLVGSILQHAELSTTLQPAWANIGAYFWDASLPAEKIARDGFISIASSGVTTSYSLPLNITFFPFDLADATGIRLSIGKFLSSSTFNILEPTSPVAPTTARFIFHFIF